MPRNPDHNYGNAHGITVDDCGRCHVKNARGIRLVKPDGTGDLPTLIEICSPCALKIAEGIVSMVVHQLRQDQR